VDRTEGAPRAEGEEATVVARESIKVDSMGSAVDERQSQQPMQKL